MRVVFNNYKTYSLEKLSNVILIINVKSYLIITFLDQPEIEETPYDKQI